MAGIGKLGTARSARNRPSFCRSASAAAETGLGHHASHGGVRVGVRPEKLTLIPAGTDVPSGANALSGRVEIASFLGTAIQYVVHTAGGEEFTAVEQNRLGSEPDSIGPGRDVTLAWDPAHSILVAKEPVDA